MVACVLLVPHICLKFFVVAVFVHTVCECSEVDCSSFVTKGTDIFLHKYVTFWRTAHDKWESSGHLIDWLTDQNFASRSGWTLFRHKLKQMFLIRCSRHGTFCSVAVHRKYSAIVWCLLTFKRENFGYHTFVSSIIKCQAFAEWWRRNLRGVGLCNFGRYGRTCDTDLYFEPSL
jgi:hypothetical protein